MIFAQLHVYISVFTRSVLVLGYRLPMKPRYRLINVLLHYIVWSSCMNSSLIQTYFSSIPFNYLDYRDL